MNVLGPPDDSFRFEGCTRDGNSCLKSYGVWAGARILRNKAKRLLKHFADFAGVFNHIGQSVLSFFNFE